MNLILVKQAIIIIVQDRNSRDLDCAVTFHKCTELICLLSYHSRSYSCGVGTRLWHVLVKDTRIQLKTHRGRFRLWSASAVLFPLHCIDRRPVNPSQLLEYQSITASWIYRRPALHPLLELGGSIDRSVISNNSNLNQIKHVFNMRLFVLLL